MAEREMLRRNRGGWERRIGEVGSITRATFLGVLRPSGSDLEISHNLILSTFKSTDSPPPLRKKSTTLARNKP